MYPNWAAHSSITGQVQDQDQVKTSAKYSSTPHKLVLARLKLTARTHRRRPDAKVNFVRPRLIKYMTLSILASMKEASEACEVKCGLIGLG